MLGKANKLKIKRGENGIPISKLGINLHVMAGRTHLAQYDPKA